MVKIDVVVNFDNGLHSRPAGTLVELVKASKSEVFIVTKNGVRVNGRSLIRILTTGIKEKEEISIEINGEDEKRVAQALSNLFG